MPMKNKIVKASMGKGKNKIEFDMPIETAKKVLNLQRIIKEQREKDITYKKKDENKFR